MTGSDNNNPKALVLAAGMGTRLQPYTFFVPKPMLPIADKPLLEHLVLWLKSNGVEEVMISVSYLKHYVEDYFNGGERWNLKIEYSRSENPLGIGGQILNASDRLPSTFYLLYGDSLFDFDLRGMLEFHRDSKAALTMGLMHHSERSRYGLIERDQKTGRVLSWREKPELGGLINVGCYVAEPKLFDYIPRGRMYGFDQVVRDMMDAKETVVSYVIEGKEFLDIGDKKSYKKAYDLYMEKLGRIL